MPVVLVIDDSAADQQEIQSIFAAHSGFEIRVASTLDEALDSMRADRPDLMLVDPAISEPSDDPIRRIKADFPGVPAIIVTTLGNEKLAIRALKSGAASYIPNHLLPEELLPTVRDVLEVSRVNRCRLRMLEQMEDFQCSFVLQNDRSLLPPLVSYLQEHFARMGICEEADITRVGIALDEALVNALFHGNLELDSSLRETDNDSYHQLAQQRATQDPYQQRRLRVDVRMSRDVANICIRDEGKGFDPSKLPDPTDPANLEKVSGRGVLLMRTFMDDVVFNDAGNCVTLTKRRSANGDGSDG